MSYIGSPPSTQSFAPGTDTFSGDGTTVAFTLSRNVGTVNDILVVVNNVDQQPTAYTVSVSTLTFTAAPSSGTNNIYVRYLSTNLTAIAPQQGSVFPSSLSTGGPTWDTSGNVVINGTGYFDLPAGTTAQRPVTALAGYTRFNTTLNYPEWYNAVTGFWLPFSAPSSYSVEYLVVAGGGGGGSGGATASGGGGGAGGYLTTSVNVDASTAYTVTIGGGGAESVNGTNSVFGAVTAIGGGYGGTFGSGNSGGSGGGASGANNTFGSGTSGQGNRGGSGFGNVGAVATGGGGGGGAGGVGGNAASASSGGASGAGLASSIRGSSVTYAAGGSGGSNAGAGSGGGVNTGNGGGGAAGSGAGATAGGSGIVVVRYLGSQRATGGTVTSSGGYTIHTFTTSGTFTA
jgi:hypothetical protein